MTSHQTLKEKPRKFLSLTGYTLEEFYRILQSVLTPITYKTADDNLSAKTRGT